MENNVGWRGWIYKQGSRIPTWKRRYIVLQGNHVAYFDKEVTHIAAKEKGQLILDTIEKNDDMIHGITLVSTEGKAMRIYTKTVGEFCILFDALSRAATLKEQQREIVQSPPKRRNTRNFVTPEALEHAGCCGWREKEGRKVKNWKRRYFVLIGDELLYHDKMGNLPKGGGYVLEVAYDPQRLHSLQIILDTDRILKVTADSKRDMQMWFNALTRALQPSYAVNKSTQEVSKGDMQKILASQDISSNQTE